VNKAIATAETGSVVLTPSTGRPPEQSASDVWRAVLGELQLQLPRPTFDTWLKRTEAITYDNHNFVVAVPTTFAVAWLERRMYQAIQKAVERVAHCSLDIQFQVMAMEAQPVTEASMEPQSQEPVAVAPMTLLSRQRNYLLPPFNPRYTFATYVVGPSNRLAYSAARAIADAPGQAYNPLFLYSAVGLGKTHLLHAIGQACAKQGKDVLYVSSEQFTNDFISAIRNRTTEEFRERYRSVDVLLLDDVQFMGGKEQTQEAFFHTFNDLHNAGHQIIMTSDRPPNSLALLEDRLRSRFEWGLIADIQPPDLETRIAIVTTKAEQLHVTLDYSVIELITKRTQKNVRELEGNLNRVVAYYQLMNVPITLDSTSRILDDLTSDAARHTIDPERIIQEVSRRYKISTGDILGRVKTKLIAQARQVVMYMLIFELKMSPTQVGRLLGGRDHSTVIYGAGKINGEINEDSQLRQDVLAVKEAIFA
jgi:chromosomal replication initiator protein